MSASDLASTLYTIQTENWMAVSMDALAIFEYITTFDQELSLVWKRKRSGASCLLFAARYTMLATAICDIFIFAPLSYKECVGYYTTSDILEPVSLLLMALFSALRVYALSGGKVVLPAIAFLLQLSPVCVNVYSYVGNTYIVDPLIGCDAIYAYGLKTEEMLIFASRIPSILGDVLVVITTWIKSIRQLKMQRSLGMHLPLSTLLFRDGTAYFLILLIMNILELCPLTSANSGLIIGDLTATLPLILIHRFMLNLRQLGDSETNSDGHIRTVSTPMFRMTRSIDITGNMGESLEHGWEAGAEHDDGLDAGEALRDDESGIQLARRGFDDYGSSEHRSV